MKLESIKDGGRIAVAMSGGVDSSVAAALMVEAGYEVVGITLQLYDHGAMISKKGACCAGQDIYDAKRVSEKLGFPHYVLDYESIFKQDVIDDFADSYMRGETPIPCVRCNQRVKFRDLLKMSKDLGCEALVTGHYVKRVNNNGEAELHKAIDLTRDQSYFLFSTTQEQLDYLRFPLGDFEKSRTRKIAESYGLSVADKPDSQDICFVPNGRYSDVVKKLRPDALDPGEIVDIDGNVLGRHQGIINFTVGQRKGIGLSSASPLYVIKIDPETKRVVIGDKSHLQIKNIEIKEVNWLLSAEYFKNGRDVEVKVRSTQAAIPARVSSANGAKARITLHTNEYGISRGQACVFFEGTRVLGGGWIESTSS